MAAGVQNRLFDRLFAFPEIAKLFAEDHMLAQFLQFEVALTRACGVLGLVGNADHVIDRMSGVKVAPEDLIERVGTDGVPVPAYVAALKGALGDGARGVHIGATSQDLMDTALALSLRDISTQLEDGLCRCLGALDRLEKDQGARSLMGRTRMQAALPITVADRLQSWRTPLQRSLDKLPSLRQQVEQVQYGGPVGQQTADRLRIAALMAEELGLHSAGAIWHSARDGVADYGNWLALVTGSLGKIGQDIALMAQQGVDDVRLAGGGKSSAMPHKQNPILAETLVTLARFNAVQVSGLHQAMVHEQERSGAAWALEWMILPQMCEATGAALRLATDVLNSVETLGKEPV